MLLMRSIVFPLTGLLLAGCMQSGALAPSSEANFTARDKQQLANPPYQRASISPTYQRQIVQYQRRARKFVMPTLAVLSIVPSALLFTIGVSPATSAYETVAQNTGRASEAAEWAKTWWKEITKKLCFFSGEFSWVKHLKRRAT